MTTPKQSFLALPILAVLVSACSSSSTTAVDPQTTIEAAVTADASAPDNTQFVIVEESSNGEPQVIQDPEGNLIDVSSESQEDVTFFASITTIPFLTRFLSQTGFWTVNDASVTVYVRRSTELVPNDSPRFSPGDIVTISGDQRIEGFVIADRIERFDVSGPITVNTTADTTNSVDGLCSLREAITSINTGLPSSDVPGECLGTGTIDLTGLAGVIILQEDLPAITTDVAIEGPGSGTLAISGNDNFRIFSITDLEATVAINDLSLIDGETTDGGSGVSNFGILTINNSTLSGHSTSASGGAISNLGTLTMNAATVTDNRAQTGGGILNLNTLTINNSTISDNTADVGAGIITARATVAISNSTISSNTAVNGGGGLYQIGSFNPGRVTITDSSIQNNRATDGNSSGGGIVNAGILEVTRSTISGNQAAAGGGLFNTASDLDDTEISFGSATATLVNSTLSGNSSSFTANPGSNSGAAIFNSEETLIVRNSTFAGNGGDFGLFGDAPTLTNSGGSVTVTNSLFVNTIADGNNCSGVNIGGSNLSDDLSCGGAQVNGSAGGLVFNGEELVLVFGPLANNGGPTQTHALLPLNPALNAGSNVSTSVSTDQRGLTRIVGGTVDIGAYERQ